MWSRSAKTNGVELIGTALFLTLLVTYERDTPLHGYGDTMKIGDLVKSSMNNGILGIIVEAYDSPKGLWLIAWMDGGAFHQGSLAHENNFEVIS